jgi:CHAT domain-containing protein
MKTFALISLLLQLVTLSCAAHELPARYVELIRHERFHDAEAAADENVARIESNAGHKPLCDALDLSLRVSAFDIYAPASDKLSRTERALHCREGLADSKEKRTRVVALKAALAVLVFSGGDRQRAKDLFTETQVQIKRDRARVDVIDYTLATMSLSSVASLADSDFTTALAWLDEGLSAVHDDDVTSRMLRVRLLTVRCHRLGRLGRFAEAEDAGRTASELAAKIFGVPSTHHAYALQTLGEVQYFAHHLADATLTMESAIDDSRKLPRVGDNLAVNLMVFANIQTDIGDFARARAALKEAIAIEHADQSLGHKGDLGAMLGNLGMLEAQSGHCADALAPEREALHIMRERYGEDSQSLTSPLAIIGACEIETDKLGDARVDYGRAFAIALQKLGEGNPQIAEAYDGLAQVDLAAHDYANASAHLAHALERLPLDADTLGKQRLAIERHLARSLHAQHRDADAFLHAAAGESMRQRLLQHFAARLDEGEGLGLNETELDNLDEILALAAAQHDPALIEHAWQLEIGSRAQVTRLVAARLKAARAGTSARTGMLWQQWKNANAAYADALAQADDGKAASNLADARNALERAEQALAAQTHVPGAVAPADIAALRAALPSDGALVGFVAARSDPWDNDFTSVLHPRHYFAFRLLRSGPIALLDLGDARDIDAAVRDWIAALRDPERPLADVDALGDDVARRVWRPLNLPHDVRHVALVPEGELHRIAWLGLRVDGESLVAQGIVPQLLDTEREALSVPARSDVMSRPLLVGAVAMPLALRSTCGGVARDLPGAQAELDALRRLWRTSAAGEADYLVGANANKAALRAAMPRSGAIHFATHTFSDDGSDCAKQLATTRGLALPLGTEQNSTAPSGLVLAADPHAAPGDRDGLLTGAEIATFDLDGVDTVTLAACDTGSGPVHPDEGVFGLARSFRLAGARDVVMSLWNVDDNATAELMQHMYRARWLDHATAADALARAARETRAARQAAGLSTHPYYWAAFVALGN